jgi:hypothetical protein
MSDLAPLIDFEQKDQSVIPIVQMSDRDPSDRVFLYMHLTPPVGIAPPQYTQHALSS